MLLLVKIYYGRLNKAEQLLTGLLENQAENTFIISYHLFSKPHVGDPHSHRVAVYERPLGWMLKLPIILWYRDFRVEVELTGFSTMNFFGKLNQADTSADTVGVSDVRVMPVLRGLAFGQRAFGTGRNPQKTHENPIFEGWATGWLNYLPSDAVGNYGVDGIGSQFADPDLSLGPVTNSNMDIVTLGDMDQAEIDAYDAGTLGYGPGEVTFTFDMPIVNGDGADFAAFENGFISAGGAGVAGEIFAELGYVEVSSNGTHFARFASDSLTPDLVGAYGTADPTDVYNLVGKHCNAYGS